MHLDNRNGEQFQGIMDGNRCMCIGCSVNNNACIRAGRLRGLLDPTYQFTFVVGLAKMNANAKITRGILAQFLNVSQGLMAINFRLPLAEHIQIRPVEDKDCVHNLFGLCAGLDDTDRCFYDVTIFEMQAQWEVVIQCERRIEANQHQVIP